MTWGERTVRGESWMDFRFSTLLSGYVIIPTAEMEDPGGLVLRGKITGPGAWGPSWWLCISRPWGGNVVRDSVYKPVSEHH